MDSVKEQLWQILDDLDTLDDAARDDDYAFRRKAIKIVARRDAVAVAPVEEMFSSAPSATAALWGTVGLVADLDAPSVSNKDYRRRVQQLVKQRLRYAVSNDGQALVWLDKEQS